VTKHLVSERGANAAGRNGHAIVTAWLRAAEAGAAEEFAEPRVPAWAPVPSRSMPSTGALAVVG